MGAKDITAAPTHGPLMFPHLYIIEGAQRVN